MDPALEVMVTTERVRELIEDPHRTREINDAISQGRHPYGMMSFDQSLAELVKSKLVTYDEAVKNSTSPSDFALLFRGVSGGNDDWRDDGGGHPGAHEGRAPTGGGGAKPSGGFEIERFGK
jgi:twitching motility protein PilT